MRKLDTVLQQADAALFAAVEKAVQEAAEVAGEELKAQGVRKSPSDYFADGALRYLFLRLCGADPETNAGGNPEAAWEILYAGRNVARHWERERGGVAALRKRKERSEDLEKDESERRQLAASARDFAIKTVIRALVDHVRSSDPQLEERLASAVDARFLRHEDPSDMDREFAEQAKRYLAVLTAL